MFWSEHTEFVEKKKEKEGKDTLFRIREVYVVVVALRSRVMNLSIQPATTKADILVKL